MRMRPHRRSLMVWSSPGSPAGRIGAPAFTPRRPGPIRRWLRTGALLTVIGIARLAHVMQAHWRFALTVTGAPLVVIGVMLPSGWAFLGGLLALLLALLGGAESCCCRAAGQMTGARWQG
jgi:hypothetical protein